MKGDVFYVAYVNPETGEERVSQCPYRTKYEAREYADFLAGIGEAKDVHIRAALEPTGQVIEEFTHVQEDIDA